MRSPEKYLKALLGDLSTITVLGKEYDLYAVVSIPSGEDMEDILTEHPVRVAAWKRIYAKCHKACLEAQEEYEAVKSDRFVAYWNHLEEREREELNRLGKDEDAPRDDFNRRIRGKARISEGRVVSLGRWRRNFSDDLVWGYVRNDDKVHDARTKHRDAKEQLEVVQSVIDALEHRARCLSHLAAYHRDATK